jgi:PAS domain S-box-containing protein
MNQPRRMRAALRENEERPALAASAAGVGLFEWDVKTGNVVWTEQTSRLLGLPVKKRKGTPVLQPHSYQEWADRIHPEDLRRIERALRRCVREGRQFDEEYRVVWQDGSVHWLHGRGIFQYDTKGKPERMLGIDMDIGDRVRVEEALRGSEARYRTLFEQSGDGIVVVNGRGRIIMANRRLARLFGYRRKELLGQPVEMLIPERLRRGHAVRRKAYQAAPRLRRMCAGPGFFGRRKDGSEFPIEIGLSPVRIKNDVAVTGIVRDVSERTRIEAQLKELAATLEARVAERTRELTDLHSELQTTLESIADGFFVCDCQWRFIYLNAAAERILRFRREDVLGKTFWEVFPLTLGTRLEREYQLAAAGEVREFENLYEPWGRWFYNRCFPREGGGVTVYFTELTERKVAEEVWHGTEERLRAIIASAPVGILSTDESGIVEALNPAALELFGYSQEEVLGRKIGRFLADPAQGQNDDFLPRFLQASGKAPLGLRREVLGRRKDGRVIMLEVTVAEFFLGRERKFVAMARDITAIKQLERELLEGGERERQRLGNDLHDGLGQHLHALYYRTTLLTKDLREDGSPRTQEAARLSRLLHQAIELARGLARGLQPVAPVPEGLMTSLRELAERTTDLYRVDCQFECSAPILIREHSAATHLYRIAQEALNNAMRHGRPTRVRIRLGVARDKVILGVRDNGVGIRRRVPEARGIGFHIMQHRADALSGSLVVQKIPGGGTEVVCTANRQTLIANHEQRYKQHNETKARNTTGLGKEKDSRRGRPSADARRDHPVDSAHA